MDIQIGDILIMKKPHPCGECRFTVGRVGMDLRIRCNGCGREVMVARAKVEKNIRRVMRGGEELDRRQLAQRRLSKPGCRTGRKSVSSPGGGFSLRGLGGTQYGC